MKTVRILYVALALSSVFAVGCKSKEKMHAMGANPSDPEEFLKVPVFDTSKLPPLDPNVHRVDLTTGEGVTILKPIQDGYRYMALRFRSPNRPSTIVLNINRMPASGGDEYIFVRDTTRWFVQSASSGDLYSKMSRLFSGNIPIQTLPGGPSSSNFESAELISAAGSTSSYNNPSALIDGKNIFPEIFQDAQKH